VVGGSTPKTGVAEYWGGDIPWVTPADLSRLGSHYISDTPRKITSHGLAKSGARLLPAESVLFSSRAPIGHVAINLIPMATNQGFKSLVPDVSRLDPKYLFWWLRANTSFLQGLGVGATFKEVSKTIVSAVRIPLPPLPEQRRIASILDQADALRTKRCELLATVRASRGSAFRTYFGDIWSDSSEWHRQPIRSLAVKYSDGPFGSNLKSSHYEESGVRVIRLQNIGVNEFVDNDQAYVSPTHFETIRNHECLPGDVLIGTLGEPNLRACIQPSWLAQAVNKADCVQFRADTSKVLPDYVVGLLNSASTVSRAGRLVLGQTRGRISMGRLGTFAVPVPDLALQHEYSRVIALIAELEADHTTHLTLLDELFASLQHRAFRGEL
jgi:type I restriction enzyme S subunit